MALSIVWSTDMKLRFPAFLLALCGGTLMLATMPVVGWGPEGHAIVADIAQAHLTPAASAEVAALLQLEGYSRLDEISSWADGNRKDYPETGPWHYVDTPLSAASYDAARDCAQGACVVAKLDEYTQVLANKAASPQQRLLALKWVVHLVGDIHQPLHAEDHNDKGGNTVQAQFFGKGTNLHSLWDGGVLRRALDLRAGPHFTFDHAIVQGDATTLDEAITSAQRAEWAPAGGMAQTGVAAIGWANESHRLAQTVAYTDIDKPSGDAWSQRYQQKAWPVIQTRLQQGGVRLADLLNEALTE